MGTVFVAPPMVFTVLLCFLVTALTPVCSLNVPKEVRYECGAHGKFEYCIDEVPGCVIGCHCHPGYYFDTDSKICEPNVKLSQHFQQQYFAKPSPTTTAYPIPTATAHFVDKAHEISKDTDELGDWLYNQFFKTIESQVISSSNNTKSSNEKPPTRRTGGGRVMKKSQRKTSIRGRKKRKHMRKRGLKKKLLRITEDDSLFDSDSDSDDSDSSSYESDTSSDESVDINTSDGNKSSETDGSDDKDCDHGHKKVLIFNRRPKPPLPSFIFLPNMDTSFYPPIGLPPPPLVPMYPMVPVPPMAPPIFPPFPEPEYTTAHPDKTTTTVDPTATTTETTTQTTTETVTDPTTQPTNETSTDTVERRNRHPKHRKNRPGKQNKLKYEQQNKLMQKLREKLKGIRRKSLSPTHAESQVELLQNSDDVPNISEDYTPQKRFNQLDQEENHIPKLEDVDFKYLSELIHKVNQSKSRNRPPLPFDLNDDLKELQKLQQSQPTRRHFGAYNPMPQIERQGTDDIYYSNLGRQIASMIRNADSKVDHQFIKDSEHRNGQVPFHSVLNENSFPHSFWERSVRSPVLHKAISPLFDYLDESRTLKHSNEISLINLENEVQIFANTPTPLSLQDLENVLNTMQKVHAQYKFRQPMTNTKQSNVSLNINLLPKHVRPDSTYSRLFDAPEKGEYKQQQTITEYYQAQLQPRVYVEMHPAVVANASVFHEPKRMHNVPYSDYWMYLNPKIIQSKPNPRPVFGQTSKPIVHDNQIYNTNLVEQPFVGVLRPKHNETKKSVTVQYLQFLRSRPVTKQTTPKIRELKVNKNKIWNYFTGHKHYMFEPAAYPISAPFKTTVNKRSHIKPSYFHPLNQFEYFD